MKSFFILTLITSISQAKTVVAPLGNDQFLTVNDFQKLQIGFLVFVIYVAGGILKSVWDLFFSDSRDDRKRIKEIETTNALILQKLETIEKSLARAIDSQMTESEVRNLIRDEASYIERLKRN